MALLPPDSLPGWREALDSETKGAIIMAALGLSSLVLVPVGFAHGFCTLEPDTEVFYKVSAPYSAAHDRSIRFDDPDIGIDWPLAGQRPILSAKDEAAPLLSHVETPFVYGA